MFSHNGRATLTQLQQDHHKSKKHQLQKSFLDYVLFEETERTLHVFDQFAKAIQLSEAHQPEPSLPTEFSSEPNDSRTFGNLP